MGASLSPRAIVHVDLDAFYASVAQRDDPSLRGKPVAVSRNARRAVVLTASYEARPFGVRSAMPLYQALERCPRLVVVPPDFAAYKGASAAVFAIIREAARAIERLSLDEAYLDLDDATIDQAVQIARALKARVRAETGLTLSAGVASGKMVAKIASDDGKPDGLVVVPAGTEAAYLADKPVARLWGVGPKTEIRLRELGIERIAQVAELSDERAIALFGRGGIAFRDLALGIDDRPVIEDDEVRSISSEETFEHDERSLEALLRVVRAQADELEERLRKHELRAFTVGVKVKLSDFSVLGRQTTLAQPTDRAAVVYGAAAFCLKRAALDGRAVRLIGTRVAGLVERPPEQISLFGKA
ncbi:MAG TPA: DNA polymerase IV [Candidatus Dormibacteraeota bacterium]|nr:DNA polymerase IV [Candidatus Dormibacteraeota bacterium]